MSTLMSCQEFKEGDGSVLKGLIVQKCYVKYDYRETQTTRD